MTHRGLITAVISLFCLAFSAAAPRLAAEQTLADLVQINKAAQEGGALFGSIELESGSLKGLPQWTRMLGAMARERKSFDDCAADASLCTTPILKHWRNILASAAKLKREDRIKAVGYGTPERSNWKKLYGLPFLVEVITMSFDPSGATSSNKM